MAEAQDPEVVETPAVVETSTEEVETPTPETPVEESEETTEDEG